MEGIQNKFLQALRNITEAVSGEHDLYKSMALLVSHVRKAADVDCCSLYLSDALRKSYRLLATDGLSAEAVGKIALKFGEGLVGVVGESRELLNLADAQSHPDFKFLPDVGEDEFVSFLGVPILNQGELLGVLVIQSKNKQLFGEQEESFMITLAAQIGSVIARSKRENSIEDDVLKRIKGLDSTGNLAIGRALVRQPVVSLEQVKLQKTDDPAMQIELFNQIMFQLQLEMDQAVLEMKESEQNMAVNGYLSGYGSLLDDTSFQEEVISLIENESYAATAAVCIVTKERLGEEDLNPEKRTDITDFAQTVISRLVNAADTEFDFAEPVILIMDDMPASMLADLRSENILGFVTTGQVLSNHINVLARDLNVPAVFGAPLNLEDPDGRLMIVDGRNCEVILDPPDTVVEEFRQLLTQTHEQHDLFTAERLQTVDCLDGRHIKVCLNAGLSMKDDPKIMQESDGIGLYRTEIAYMMCQSFPTEQQQYEWYSKLLENCSPKPVCMRTLDIGADKGLTYLPNEESNPALGWRGVRVTQDMPNILHTQLMAMMRAHQKYGNLEIMIPMVSSLDEVRSVKNAVIEAANALRLKSGQEVTIPKFGVMVEVPALCYIMDELAAEVDFFSVGSNDLIQYMIAVDRTNQKVNRLYDCFHPAVVRCLKFMLDKAAEYNKRIYVCGEMAGDPLGALLLLSLGCTELSMNYSDLLQIKYILRRVSFEQLAETGRQALKLSDAAAIRELYRSYAVSQGLGKVLSLQNNSNLRTAKA